MKGSLLTLLAAFFLCTSCASTLHVHTDYLTRDQLASTYVHTPDPSLENPTLGQRLHISWALTQDQLYYDEIYLDIQILYWNKQFAKTTLPITQRSGTHIYSLFDDDYFTTGGIRTYKVTLIADGQPLDTWRHQLWVDPISFS